MMKRLLLAIIAVVAAMVVIWFLVSAPIGGSHSTSSEGAKSSHEVTKEVKGSSGH